jgi:two-component system response regulator (stage 0 sporulation protein F)
MHALGQHATDEVFDPARPALRVLVIDDDDCVGAAIKAILSRRRSDTRLASRAYVGIETLESSSFDLVLIDLFMPGMNGLEAITYIRRQSDIPIIAMSGLRLRDSLNSVDYLRMAMDRGASTSIRKPFTPKQLIEAIDNSFILSSSRKGPS